VIVMRRKSETIQASLQHLAFLPQLKGDKFATVIAIHGRGADESDLVPVVSALELPDLLLITPRAPFAFPFGGFVWYNIAEESVPDPETFQISLGLLRKFIEEVREGYPVEPKRMLLLGFSQGTVMAYAAGLPDHSRLRGIAALSGYVPHRSAVPLQLRDLAGFPVFISHGHADPIIPVHLGREAAQLLMKAGADVNYHEYPMGHEVTGEVIADLSEWTRMRLASLAV